MSSQTTNARSVADPIPLCVPAIRGNEWNYLKACLDTNFVSSVGPFVDRFERELAARVGTRFAVATASGTAALHVALLIAGIQPDDEVLVSTLTFIAPANAIRYARAWPVFMDAEPDYWQMDPQKVKDFLERECKWRDGALRNKATGRRVSAILPVHVLGHPVDFDPIREQAGRFGLRIIEDATECLGARYKGRPAGHLGDVACFSFNGNKLITTGGGGMIVTDHEAWASKAKYLTTQAKDDAVEFIHGEVGYNYRLTNLQAAMGCAQLESVDDYIAAKRRIAATYAEAFQDLAGLQSMREAPWAESIFWMFSVLVNAAEYGRDSRALLRRLEAASIQTRPLWQPLHRSPAHAGAQAYHCDVADRLNRDGLSLPCSVGLTAEQQQRVIQQVREAADLPRPSSSSSSFVLECHRPRTRTKDEDEAASSSGPVGTSSPPVREQPRVESRSCPVCGGRERHHLYSRRFAKMSHALLDGYDVVACQACGFCYADQLPSQDQFDAYYEAQSKYEFDYRQGGPSEYDTRRFPFAVGIIGEWLPDRNARILDIGCATGGLLAELKRQGYANVVGVDPSPACARAAKHHYDLAVTTAPVSRIPDTLGRFDLVILGSVLEHVCDLNATVRQVGKLLTPNGRVFVEVPDMSRCSLMKDAPFQEFSVEHINFFSPVSLQNLWCGRGFRLIGSRQTEIDQRPGLTIYEVKAMFQRAADELTSPLPRDTDTIEELRRYIAQSAAKQQRIEQTINVLADQQTPIVVWGVGTHTQGLLATTRLREARIVAFVDSNARYVGQQLHGVPILPVSALADHAEPVLVSSQQFQEEIVDQIQRQLRLPNSIITLYEAPPRDGAQPQAA